MTEESNVKPIKKFYIKHVPSGLYLASKGLFLYLSDLCLDTKVYITEPNLNNYSWDGSKTIEIDEVLINPERFINYKVLTVYKIPISEFIKKLKV